MAIRCTDWMAVSTSRRRTAAFSLCRIGRLHLVAERRQFEFHAGQFLSEFIVDLARNPDAFLLAHKFQAGGQISELVMRERQLLLRPLAFGDVDEDHHRSGDLPLLDDRNEEYSTTKAVPSLRQ